MAAQKHLGAVAGVILGFAYGVAGAFSPALAGFSVLLVLPAMAGMFIGERIRQCICADAFKNCILIIVLLIGAGLIHRAAAG